VGGVGPPEPAELAAEGVLDSAGVATAVELALEVGVSAAVEEEDEALSDVSGGAGPGWSPAAAARRVPAGRFRRSLPGAA